MCFCAGHRVTREERRALSLVGVNADRVCGTSALWDSPSKGRKYERFLCFILLIFHFSLVRIQPLGLNSLVLQAGWVTWPHPRLLAVGPHLSSEIRQPEPPWV